jgi:uncharacterized protein RhaS with RHS repeats
LENEEKEEKTVKKTLVFILAVLMCLTMAACGGNDKVVRTEEWVTDDGMEITQGYNKDDIVITETAKMPDGSVYEHRYDAEGNHISEICTLADGSYHEFQYDKNGNVTKEVHK